MPLPVDRDTHLGGNRPSKSREVVKVRIMVAYGTGEGS